MLSRKFSRIAARASSTAAIQCKALALSMPSPYVLQVDLNRPKKLNAMNEDFWIECEKVFDSAAIDPEVRAIVCSAAGDRMFSAGIDLAQLAGELGAIMALDDIGRKAFALRRMIPRLQRPLNAIADCPKPVIAATFGGNIGGALDFLSACDIRYASNCAWFTIKEVDVGLAADLGTLQRFPKIIGNDSMARELALSARKFDAAEAKDIGFVSKVYQGKEETLANALSMAKLIAEKSPVAVQGTKIVMNYSREHTIADGLTHIAEWNAAQLQSEDLMKSAQAAMMKMPLSQVEFEDL